MNIGFFSAFWQAVAVRITDATAQLVAALMGWVGRPFQLCVVAYLIIMLLIAAWSSDETAFQRFFRQLWLAVIIYTLATSATAFNYYVTGLVNGLINDITRAIAGIFGGSGAVTANSFDIAASKLFAVGATVFQGLPWYSPKAWILGFSILGYWALSGIALTVIYFVYLVSIVATNFVVAFGPLFIAMYFFPMTRLFFDGWLRCVVAGILMQIFTIGWLALFLTTLTALLATITTAAHGGSGVNDIASQILALILAAALVSIFSTMTAFSALLAIRISSGAHAELAKLQAPAWMGGGEAYQLLAAEPPTRSGHTSVVTGTGGDPFGASSAPPRQYAFNRTVGAAP
jgi:type IV secretory pathway VirB6-like protein